MAAAAKTVTVMVDPMPGERAPVAMLAMPGMMAEKTAGMPQTRRSQTTVMPQRHGTEVMRMVGSGLRIGANHAQKANHSSHDCGVPRHRQTLFSVYDMEHGLLQQRGYRRTARLASISNGRRLPNFVAGDRGIVRRHTAALAVQHRMTVDELADRRPEACSAAREQRGVADD
ncbi:MAG: hypothetical protein ACNA7W_00745 [Pseudomonadales bacterium]